MKTNILGALAAILVLSGCWVGVDDGYGWGWRPHPRCWHGSDPVTHSYSDYQGKIYQETRAEDAHYWCRHTADTLGVEMGPVAVGNEFGVSFDSAQRLIAAMTDASQKNFSELQNIGFKKGDLKAMSKFQMPSDKTIDNVAHTLDQWTPNTRAMLAELLAESKEDAAKK